MSASLIQACVPATFSPSVFGAEVLSIEANVVTNFIGSAPTAVRSTQPSVQAYNLTICNIAVTYTHPGMGDEIIVEAWLPIDNWNGRLQAIGGGGWSPGSTLMFSSPGRAPSLTATQRSRPMLGWPAAQMQALGP